MGHYDENRRFDEEWREAHSGVYVKHPIEKKPKTVKFEVTIPTEILSPHTFIRWTDGTKWVCDTVGIFDMFSDGSVNVITAKLEDIEAVIETHQHGTFYVIARQEDVAGLIKRNPQRDIRHLITA